MVDIWNGARRIAFIPVSDAQVDDVVPDDFQEQVYRRVYIDPDPATGVDRSLQAYIQTVSSGRAHIVGDVFPPVVAPDADVIAPGLESLPKITLPFVGSIPIHGYQYAVMVLPHSQGPHRGGFAWMNNPKINGVANRARVALYTSPTFGSLQPTGVWAMEVLHAVTEMGDLYNVVPHPGRFDVMACSCGTHPSAHTKSLFGWLETGAVQAHPLGDAVSYSLHAVSYPQPPPPGRVTAVRVKSQTTPGEFLVESRLKTDNYELPSSASSGIPSEGVVVYEVQGPTMVFLRASGLGPGDTFEIEEESLRVEVTEAIAGGFEVSVNSRATVRCRELRQEIEALQSTLEHETDPVRRKAIISRLAGAHKEHRELLCDEIPGLWNESVDGRLLGTRIEERGFAPPDPDPARYPS